MSRIGTIKHFVIEEFLPDVSANELSVEYDLLENGVIDSLGLLKLIAWIEERFELSVHDTDLDPANFHSVAAINSFIDDASEQKLAGI
ncbi:MAG: phosphopantetheine-binding protein [Pseudonocardiaceae bacterium]